MSNITYTIRKKHYKQGETLHYYAICKTYKVGFRFLWITFVAFWNNTSIVLHNQVYKDELINPGSVRLDADGYLGITYYGEEQ